MPVSHNGSINNNNNVDDYYHRVDATGQARVFPQEVAGPSPFDHNPNPGSALPEWRQFGFESEEQYRMQQHHARI